MQDLQHSAAQRSAENIFAVPAHELLQPVFFSKSTVYMYVYLSRTPHQEQTINTKYRSFRLTNIRSSTNLPQKTAEEKFFLARIEMIKNSKIITSPS